MKSVKEKAKSLVNEMFLEKDPSSFTSAKAIMEFAIECVIKAMETSTPKESNEPKATINERISKFREECMKYSNEFGMQMIEKFIGYWGELNKSKTKMRWEMQPTWELHRRLCNWAGKDYNKTTPMPSFPTERKKAKSVDEIMRAHYGKDAEIF